MGGAIVGSLVTGGAAVIVSEFVTSMAFAKSASPALAKVYKYGGALVGAMVAGTIYHAITGKQADVSAK